MYKKITITFIIGTLVFLLGTFVFGDYDFSSANELVEVFLFYQLYAFVLGYSNIVFFEYWYQKSFKINSIVKVILGFLGSVPISLVGLFLLRLFTSVIYNSQSFNYFIENESFKNYQFGLWVTLSAVTTFHIIYVINRYQKQQLKKQKVIAKTANAQFDALKSQLDPHFLFNSLNVLSSLIHENPDKAEQFTTKLSKVYRYVLEQKNKELVPLEEEIKFAKTYIDLLKMRFEDSLFFEFPEKLTQNESMIVPLSLQLLLENAVKHNVVQPEKPLTIKIYENANYLSIENNLQPKKILNTSSGFGLNNIKQRYNILTNKEVMILKNESLFKVQLPILTQNMTIMEEIDFYNEEDAYQRAKNRVEDLKGFYSNLISYCVIIPLLAFINYRTSWRFQWFWFPAMGWGLGLAIHAFNIFGIGSNWEERQIKKIMEKNRQNNLK